MFIIRDFAGARTASPTKPGAHQNLGRPDSKRQREAFLIDDGISRNGGADTKQGGMLGRRKHGQLANSSDCWYRARW